MQTRTQRKNITFEEFCTVVNDREKADLIDGEIYMASPENIDANDLFTWLTSILRIFLRRKKLGRVFGTRVAFRLDEYNSPEPDVAFVCTSRLHLLKRGYVDGHPDAAFEIVSPGSVEHDYQRKRELFEKFGVPEYWIIDEMEESVSLLRLNSDGEYQQVPPRKGVLRSKVIKGFWLQIDWLWQKPLPDEMDTANQLLAK